MIEETFLRSLALLVSLLLSVPLARAQGPAPLSSRDLVGEVRCEEGLPVPRYADTPGEVVHGIPRAETVRHETMHVAQLLRACDSLLAYWAAHPDAKADAEVQATCVGLTVYADTARRRQRRDAARMALGMAYVRWLPFAVIYAAFDRWCH